LLRIPKKGWNSSIRRQKKMGFLQLIRIWENIIGKQTGKSKMIEYIDGMMVNHVVDRKHQTVFSISR